MRKVSTIRVYQTRLTSSEQKKISGEEKTTQNQTDDGRKDQLNPAGVRTVREPGHQHVNVERQLVIEAFVRHKNKIT